MLKLRQFNVTLNILRSDKAKEYFSDSFQTFMVQNDILHQSSCVDTPSQNGIAERKHRHLLETAQALLFEMKVSKHFWADAVSITCFLINRMPSSILQVRFSIVFSFLLNLCFLLSPEYLVVLVLFVMFVPS